MTVVAGIDVGSLSTEVVLLDTSGRMVSFGLNPTGHRCLEAVERTLEEALRRAGLPREAVGYTVSTGYGRISIPFAQKKVTEITCHAAGAHHLFPDTGTVIDIGGQDSKIIRLDAGGKVVDFTMNDKCAAGTGRFLEVMAHAFGISIEEMGPLSLGARRAIPISSVCTVFAESEVVSLVAQGEPREEIVAGLHTAIVNRTWNMAQTVGIHGAVTMTGGVAKNAGIVRLLEERLKKTVHIYEEPQIVGALGAALLALRDLQGLRTPASKPA